MSSKERMWGDVRKQLSASAAQGMRGPGKGKRRGAYYCRAYANHQRQTLKREK